MICCPAQATRKDSSCEILPLRCSGAVARLPLPTTEDKTHDSRCDRPKISRAYPTGDSRCFAGSARHISRRHSSIRGIGRVAIRLECKHGKADYRIAILDQGVLPTGSMARVTLPEAIAVILGEHRSRWRGVEVAQMLMVSRPQIHWLRKRRMLEGKIVGNTLWIQRAALEKFLTSRYYGQTRQPINTNSQ